MEWPNQTKKVIRKFGTWTVTNDDIRCPEGFDDYPIPRQRIHEEHWIEHMREKKWPVLSDFEEAIAYAQVAWEREEA